MIFVRNDGWMCNNIIQYGHAYAWGREHGRQTVSMRFCYKFQYFRICRTRWHWFITYLLAKWGASLRLLPIVEFPFTQGHDTSLQEQQMLAHKHCIVQGWRVEFPELFLKYKSEIIELFQFKRTISQSTERWMDVQDGGDALRLGVHIRRGNYKEWQDGKFFYDDDVYIAYIRQFAAMNPNRRIAVFLSTNDGELSVERYRQLSGIPDIFIQGRGPAEDLCMLSRCDAIIGPPSTFSLTAALLGHDTLHWMMTPDANELATDGMHGFDELFTHIL